MKKLLIISGDDLGLSQGTNEGLMLAHKKGVLTSTSIMANMPDFEGGVKVGKSCPDLGMGMHLCLTWGKPILPKEKVPNLVDQLGYFNPSYAGLLTKSLTNKEVLKQAENELLAQVEKIYSFGLKIDHLNSQQHIHMIPPLYQIFKKIAKKYSIKYLRLPKEKFFLIPKYPYFLNPFANKNLIKWTLLNSFSLGKKSYKNVKFYGLMYTLNMNIDVFKYLLPVLGNGINDLLTHPALFKISTENRKKLNYDQQFITPFMKDQGRQIELATLTNPMLKELIAKNGFTLVNYKTLSKYI